MTPEQQKHYEYCLSQGTSPLLAEMFALQQCPNCMTDNVFLHGTENGKQFEKNPAMGNYFRKKALKAGVNPKGKVYKHTLADYPGDPKAWIDGRGDVRRRCEEMGWGCTGAVKVKERPREQPTEKPDIAPDIVDDYVLMAAIKDPGLREKPLGELRDQVKSKLLPRKKKRK